MIDILQDWLSLFLRWAHIVAAIGWIGSSFYFMWLDATLKRRETMDPGIKGENWSVHGGGFYHTQKYLVAPAHMPDDLHWFKWESYMTWLTGFCLLAVVYYWGASAYMIDPRVADIAPWVAVLLSLAGLAGGWLFYDVLCRSRLRDRPTAMFAVLFAAIVAAAWAYGFVFSGRATFIQVGAMIATIMTANVAMIIIPNQRIVVADLKAGRTPDAEYGRIAKLRSTHNNYLTLPVIFLMISNHYPMTFGHAWNWVVVAFALVLGAVVRNWFNTWEAGGTGLRVAWQWPAAAATAAGLALFVSWPTASGADPRFAAAAVTTPDALAIVEQRCASCHAESPTQTGFAAPPAGIRLDTAEELKRHAQQVLLQSVKTNAMPIGNLTGMTDEERARLGAWIAAGMPD